MITLINVSQCRGRYSLYAFLSFVYMLSVGSHSPMRTLETLLVVGPAVVFVVCSRKQL